MFGIELICGARTNSTPLPLAKSLLSFSPKPSNDSPPAKKHAYRKCTSQSVDFSLNLPVLGGLDGGLDSAVTDSTNDERFGDILDGIIIEDLQKMCSRHVEIIIIVSL